MRRTVSRMLALFILVSAVLTQWPLGQAAAQVDKTVRRALVVSSDRYAPPYASLGDVPSNDALLIGAALRTVGTDITTLKNISDKALYQAIADKFSGADENDISYFYYSGHGDIYRQASQLILSDGAENYRVSAEALEAAFADVKGTVVIILDSCHAGGMISKGLQADEEENGPKAQPPAQDLSDLRLGLTSPFRAQKYKVLVSAGMLEYAWTGSTYSDFTYQLAAGLGGLDGRFYADADGDGRITLQEALMWTRLQNDSSQAQAYPEYDDDFALVSYPIHDATRPLVTDVSLSASVFAYKDASPLQVAYTLPKRQRVDFELYRMEGNAKRFLRSVFQNTQDVGAHVFEWDTATLAEGTYQLELVVDAQGGAMRLPFTFDVVAHQRIEAQVYADRATLVAEDGAEMAFRVTYSDTAMLWLRVFNSQGKLVRTLADHERTRPMHFPDKANALSMNSFYWDGRDDQGEQLPAGVYTVELETGIGNRQEAKGSVLVVLTTKPRLFAYGAPDVNALTQGNLRMDLMLPKDARVTATVHARSGKKLSTIWSNAKLEAGTHILRWTSSVMEDTVLHLVVRTQDGEETWVMPIREVDALERMVIPLAMTEPTFTLFSAYYAAAAFRPAAGSQLRVSVVLRANATVTAFITNQAGEKVRTLAQDQWTKAGTVNFLWDGTSDSGAVLAGGAYTVEFEGWVGNAYAYPLKWQITLLKALA